MLSIISWCKCDEAPIFAITLCAQSRGTRQSEQTSFAPVRVG